MHNLDKDFEQFFPKFQFQLRDFQKKVIDKVINDGNTLCIMPTGGGKSLIYWMSALELGGTAIVISPLTALIEEQALKIEEQGYEVLKIHGGISAMKQMKILMDFAKGKINPNFIFLSPEKIATDGFLEHCLKKRKNDIKLLVIDEVHCVSQWGMSFRPFYKRIPSFLNELFGSENWCKLLALTATLNSKEIADICKHFKISKNNIVMKDLLMRTGIQLHVNKFANENEKTEKFWEILHNHQDEKILVYVYRKYYKHGVEELCNEANERGYRAVAFHGDMSAEERMGIVDSFKKDDVNIVFATNAFGMGIDIPDIRVVIHFMIPESIEQYYQEVGRASRDNHGANAYLLYTNKNIEIKKAHFIDGSFPNEEKLRDVYGKIAKKSGFQTLAYFEDEEIQQCLPYYVETGLINIVCKGFSDLASLQNIQNDRLQNLYDSTKKKGFIRTVNYSEKDKYISPKELAELVYESLLSGQATTNKALERWLIIRVNETEISNERMNLIIDDINEKKNYKHQLLDYFTYLLENNSNTQHLHQEIAAYLGTEKHNLALIYETNDGTYVRSKSEAIIANLLYAANIKYKYEEKLYYTDTKWIEPDFTIYLPNGEKLYWEHIGMLGKEEYDVRWSEKIDIYKQYFPGQMIKTYESGVLSNDALRLIQDIKEKA